MAGINQIKISELPTKENPSTNDYLVMDDGSETSRIKALTLFNLCYPVGSIYMSVNDIEPSVLFGGTWEKIKDRFLLGSGDTYTNGNTGGEAKHTLTTEEMPAHKHGQNINGKGTDSWNNKYGSAITLPKGSGTEGVSGMSYAVGVEDWSKKSNRVYTDSIGHSNPHNNMPPYLVVNIWQRIS